MSDPTGPPVGGRATAGGGPGEPGESRMPGRDVQLFAFVNAVADLPSLSDDAGRSTLLRLLSPPIAASVAYNPRPRMHLFNLVLTCLDCEDGLQQMLEALAGLEGGSLPMRRVLRAATALAAVRGEQGRGHGG